MSLAISPSTGKRYGPERACRVLGFPRSTIDAQRAREAFNVVPLHPSQRGPKPTIADTMPLAAIRAELTASPLVGEGQRKVWARLRILSDIPVAKDRVCSLMRENALLSPHRQPQKAPVWHDGPIQAEAPDQMWGTHGIRIQTVEDGWVWVFLTVDHFDACSVGIHAVKIGNRLAALQPVAQGLQADFGATGANAGKGLKLRMDHSTQYTADDFLNQIEFRGIDRNFALKAKPQTNGVVERFNRTLTEQINHGRLLRNLEEVRQAFTEFGDRYNRHWLLEERSFMSPPEARQSYASWKAACAVILRPINCGRYIPWPQEYFTSSTGGRLWRKSNSPSLMPPSCIRSL